MLFEGTLLVYGCSHRGKGGAERREPLGFPPGRRGEQTGELGIEPCAMDLALRSQMRTGSKAAREI